jgi:hypothetical protein
VCGAAGAGQQAQDAGLGWAGASGWADLIWAGLGCLVPAAKWPPPVPFPFPCSSCSSPPPFHLPGPAPPAPHRLQEERSLLEEGLRRFPAFPKLWLMLGQLEERLGRADAARAAYMGGLKRCLDAVPLWRSAARWAGQGGSGGAGGSCASCAWGLPTCCFESARR